MLAIRMQRTGRKGHAMFRVVVQDSRRTPSSGNIVAQLGYVDPHAKTVELDKEKTSFYLTNGAQPSERAARLLKSEGVKLPSWVAFNDAKAGKLKSPVKLRRNQPKEEKVAVEAPSEPVEAAEPVAATEPAAEAAVPGETPEVATDETPAPAEAEPVIEAETPEVSDEPVVSEAADEPTETES